MGRERKSVSLCNSKTGKGLGFTSGSIIPLADVPDETFASGALGQGFGIRPSEGSVKATFAGVITTVAPSKHAVGLISDNEMEVLIHVGVNTVDMNGQGFTAFVKEGARLAAGQELLRFDRKAIEKAGHPDVVVVLLTNSEDYSAVQTPPALAVSECEKVITVL